MEDMKGDKLAAQVITPDLSKGRQFKLDNGMEVIMLPHGEAPLVRAQLFLGGNADTSNPEACVLRQCSPPSRNEDPGNGADDGHRGFLR